MDDRGRHFLILVGYVCESAELAALPVELVLDSGERLLGHPRPIPASGDLELGDTGYANMILVGDRRVPLGQVVEFHVWRA